MTILAANTPYAPPLPPLTPARGVSLNLTVGMPTPLQRVNVKAMAAPRARASLAKLRSHSAAFASPRKPMTAAPRPEGVPCNYATLLRIEHAMATPRGANTSPRLATPMDNPSSTYSAWPAPQPLGRRVLLQQELEQRAQADFAQQAEDMRMAIAAAVDVEWAQMKAWADGASRRVRATSRGAVTLLCEAGGAGGGECAQVVLGPMLADSPALCGWLNRRGVAAAVVRTARAAAAVEGEAAAAGVVEAAEAAGEAEALAEARRALDAARELAAHAEAEAAGAAEAADAEAAGAEAVGAAGAAGEECEWGLSWEEPTEGARRVGDALHSSGRLALGVISAHLANLAGGAAGGAAVVLDEVSALEVAQACLLTRHAEAQGIGWLLRGEAPPEERAAPRDMNATPDDVAARAAEVSRVAPAHDPI